MEYYHSGSFSEVFDNYQQINEKPFSEEIMQHKIKQLIEAVKYLHNPKIFHQDIKLSSIFVIFDKIEDMTILNIMKL